MRRLIWLLLGACGRLGFTEVSPLAGDGAMPDDAPAGLQPIHQYRFAGSYADDFGGPDAVGHGGTFDGALGYQFAMNQGVDLVGAVPPEVYTVDVELAFGELTSWRKILDVKNLDDDSGFYTYDGALQYVIVPGSDFLTAPATFTPGTQTRVTLTRDAAHVVTGYLDGVPARAARATVPDPPANPPSGSFQFDDSGGVAALSGTTATFFIDDTVTGSGESTAGSVRRIRIYDVALTAAQVAASP